MKLRNVLYIPKLEANILSLRQLDEQGFWDYDIDKESFYLWSKWKVFAEVSKTHGMHYLLKLNVV